MTAYHRLLLGRDYVCHAIAVRWLPLPCAGQGGPVIGLKITLGIDAQCVDGAWCYSDASQAMLTLACGRNGAPLRTADQALATILGIQVHPATQPLFAGKRYLLGRFGDPDPFRGYQPLLSWRLMTSSDISALGPLGPAPARHEPYVFRRHGDVWHVRYAADDKIEAGDFAVNGMQGLAYYRKILPPEARLVPALTIVGVEDRRLLLDHATRQEAFDRTALAEIYGQLNQLRGEMGDARDAGNESLTRELENEMAQIQQQLRKDLRPRARQDGLRSRDINSRAPCELARKAVDGRLRHARRKIEPYMPALAAHLARYVKGLDFGFCYWPPEPRPNWEF